MNNGLIVFGICELTKGALDIFLKNNVMVYGILEDDLKWHHTDLCGIPILGATDNQIFLKLLHGACVSFLEEQANIHDLVQIGAGSVIGAYVTLEEGVCIGIGARIVAGVTIQKGVHINAGAVVLENIKKVGLLGNPAKPIHPTTI